MSRFLPGRRRRFSLYAILVFAVLALFYHSGSPSADIRGPSSTLDEGQLESFMNKLSNSKHYTLTSSFDWLTAPRKYDAVSTILLPTTKPSVLPRIQHDFPAETVDEATIRETRRVEVRNVFKKCWASYREAAWMKDEYKPISNEGKNNWGGWGATLIDSLDTLWIMGLRDEFQEAVEAVATIDFGNCTEINISVFETTIRYLGGLIGAYDLSGEKILLKQAIQVGEMLFQAFDTPNGMPIDRLNIKEAKEGIGFIPDSHIPIAGIGSLTMEFIRLAQITGNDKYYDAVARVTKALDEGQNTSFIPGLFPVFMNPQSITFNDSRATSFSIGAMADSTFEYFAKTYQLLGGVEPVYKKLYLDSMNQVDKHLLFRPMFPGNPDILFAGDVKIPNRRKPFVRDFDASMQHLSCFAGGMYALGGKLFKDDHHLSVGARLTAGCMHAYAAFPSGIMPEIFENVPCASRTTCAWNETAWQEAVIRKNGPKYSYDVQKAISSQHLPPGFAEIRDARYMLRPEAIESVFVMYRITGERKYRESAYKMFKYIKQATATDFGNAALEDVTMAEEEPERVDSMETFWLAETLKYFYLVFSPPDLISLDDYVLNTEAHPFRRPT